MIDKPTVFNYGDYIALKRRTEWVPVKDMLPEDGEMCITAWVHQHRSCPYPHYYGLAIWDATEEKWDIEETAKEDIDVLAWMPLPEPYKEDDKE